MIFFGYFDNVFSLKKIGLHCEISVNRFGSRVKLIRLDCEKAGFFLEWIVWVLFFNSAFIQLFLLIAVKKHNICSDSTRLRCIFVLHLIFTELSTHVACMTRRDTVRHGRNEHYSKQKM